ncbi:MAG TPA: response regulator transcription factor [Actinomycetota bacterium]|nr:response regulator transcription factor [Actinomycetota bacterium]
MRTVLLLDRPVPGPPPPEAVVRAGDAAETASPLTAPARGSLAPGPGQARPRVVIVDDDGTVRRDLRDLLEENDVTVAGEAGDGAAALEAVSRLVPDVVIMDNRMPVMHGIEATRRIRERFPYIQVVILTAYDEAALSDEAMGAGAYCYIVKGGPAGLLVDVVLRAARFGAELRARDAERRAPGTG